MELKETLPVVRTMIRAHLDAGYSLRRSLGAFRLEGGRLRTEDYAALWRDEVRKRAKAAA